MRISDWSSDVCSSDLAPLLADLLPRCRDRGCTAALRSFLNHLDPRRLPGPVEDRLLAPIGANVEREGPIRGGQPVGLLVPAGRGGACIEGQRAVFVALQVRSEEHTSELQSLMRISYAVFCLKKKKKH